jgi:hypothetical protein
MGTDDLSFVGDTAAADAFRSRRLVGAVGLKDIFVPDALIIHNRSPQLNEFTQRLIKDFWKMIPKIVVRNGYKLTNDMKMSIRVCEMIVIVITELRLSKYAWSDGGADAPENLPGAHVFKKSFFEPYLTAFFPVSPTSSPALAAQDASVRAAIESPWLDEAYGRVLSNVKRMFNELDGTWSVLGAQLRDRKNNKLPIYGTAPKDLERIASAVLSYSFNINRPEVNPHDGESVHLVPLLDAFNNADVDAVADDAGKEAARAKAFAFTHSEGRVVAAGIHIAAPADYVGGELIINYTEAPLNAYQQLLQQGRVSSPISKESDNILLTLNADSLGREELDYALAAFKSEPSLHRVFVQQCTQTSVSGDGVVDDRFAVTMAYVVKQYEREAAAEEALDASSTADGGDGGDINYVEQVVTNKHLSRAYQVISNAAAKLLSAYSTTLEADEAAWAAAPAAARASEDGESATTAAATLPTVLAYRIRSKKLVKALHAHCDAKAKELAKDVAVVVDWQASTPSEAAFEEAGNTYGEAQLKRRCDVYGTRDIPPLEKFTLDLTHTDVIDDDDDDL